MEITTKLDSFDINELNKLRDILENKRITNIYNNIKSEDKVHIEYDEKTIELNEKFNFKSELIRNKYYRQLLNIINVINNIKVYKYAEDKKISFVDDAIISDISVLHITSKKYKDILRMALINYIGSYNFDNIFELSKEEMLELKEYKHMNSISEYLIKLMGAFIPEKAKEEVFRALEPKIYGSKLDKIKKCKNFILICPEIIQEFCVEYFNKFKDCGIRDIFELYTIIFNQVLVHEIGHGVFDYTFDFHDDERRANYFTSITFDGTLDKIIKKKTDIQGEIDETYKNPILITENEDISETKEQIYNI